MIQPHRLHGARAESRCEINQKAACVPIYHPPLKYLTGALSTETNSNSLLEALLSVMTKHIWYAIIQNNDENTDDIGTGLVTSTTISSFY